MQEWDDIGVERSWFSTVDYRPPSLASIREGLEVISEHKLRNECVYIHCKAGRGRSALVASCYLMKVSGLYIHADSKKCLHCTGECIPSANSRSHTEKFTPKILPHSSATLYSFPLLYLVVCTKTLLQLVLVVEYEVE